MFVNALIRQRLLSPDTGDNQGNSQTGDQPKMFNQEQVDQILSKRLSKFSGIEDKLNSILKENETLKTQLADIEEKSKLAGKTELEKLQHEIEKGRKILDTLKADYTKQLSEKDSEISKYQQAIRKTKVEGVLGSALTKAKVHANALEDALEIFQRSAEIEFDDKTGKLSRIIVDDRPYEDPVKAASEFLKKKPWLASAAPGAGTGKPGNVGSNGLDVDKVSADELLTDGFANPATKNTFRDPVED